MNAKAKTTDIELDPHPCVIGHAIVHTRAGYAHATQGGYLLGLSNEQPD